MCSQTEVEKGRTLLCQFHQSQPSRWLLLFTSLYQSWCLTNSMWQKWWYVTLLQMKRDNSASVLSHCPPPLISSLRNGILWAAHGKVHMEVMISSQQPLWVILEANPLDTPNFRWLQLQLSLWVQSHVRPPAKPLLKSWPLDPEITSVRCFKLISLGWFIM